MNNIDISLSELEEDPVEKALAADASERERIFGECQQVCQPFTSFLESSGYVNLSNTITEHSRQISSMYRGICKRSANNKQHLML